MSANTPPAASASQHTSEVWWYQTEADAYTHIIRTGEHEYVASFGGQDSSGRAKTRALRAVAAYNACAGMADPAAEIAALKLNNQELWADNLLLIGQRDALLSACELSLRNLPAFQAPGVTDAWEKVLRAAIQNAKGGQS
jgi:hypothetical protein